MMNVRQPLPRRSRRLLWAAFIALVTLGAFLVVSMIAAILSQAYLLTAPLGAVLILLLWRGESWLMTWHRHLLRRETQ